ncbi:class I SAM-dependent methyltransferase [Microbispora rosea]|uniref:class I SAM-dependent methyltransferase n=1 Tax=Microbispora rosea TaxID=58117 RepID=UPI003438D1E9
MVEPSIWMRKVAADPDHSTWFIERFRAMARAGDDLAGEARLVDAMVPRRARILDAGCGTGRVGGALAEAGHDVIGVDVDPALIEAAEQDHAGPRWVVGDLAELDLAAQGVATPFDPLVCAGNVMKFLALSTRREVLRRLRSASARATTTSSATSSRTWPPRRSNPTCCCPPGTCVRSGTAQASWSPSSALPDKAHQCVEHPRQFAGNVRTHPGGRLLRTSSVAKRATWGASHMRIYAKELQELGRGNEVGDADPDDAAGKVTLLGQLVRLGPPEPKRPGGGDQVDRGWQLLQLGQGEALHFFSIKLAGRVNPTTSERAE